MSTINEYTASIFSLEGKTALVTGGATGIGYMITHALVSAGAKVYIASRKFEACQEAAESLAGLPGDCIPFAADLSEEAGVVSLAEFISENEASLNILQKYILSEWFWTFLAVTIVVLIVMIGVALGDLLGDVAGGRMPPGLIGILMVLKMPDVLSTIIPLGIFIAVIWGLGRMYRDQEMAVGQQRGQKENLWNTRLVLAVRRHPDRAWSCRCINVQGLFARDQTALSCRRQ